MNTEPELDFKKMIEDIVPLVENDFVAEMELKRHQGNFTIQEAGNMSELLGQVYLIAHCLHCKACQIKYIKGEKLSTHD